MVDPNLKLDEIFPKPSKEDWEKAATSLLKGKSIDSLKTTTLEGIELEPLYTKEELPRDILNYLEIAKYKINSDRPYLISQKIANTNFSKGVRNAIKYGVDELNFYVSDSILDELTTLKLDDSNTIFPRFYYKNFVDYGMLIDKLSHINIPLSIGASFSLAETQAINTYLDSLKNFAKNKNVYAIFEAKHEGFHLDGADSLTELVAVLSTATRYLDLLLDNNFKEEDLGKRIRLSLSIGPDFFMELAKFRATRLLWAGIQKQYGLKPVVHIHAYTGKLNKTVFDPYVNLLRLSTEAFSAIAGGVDSLELARFDETFKDYNEFSEHLSRNIHHILREEFALANVVDPAMGSYYVENLTTKIIEKVWDSFVKLESKGGVDKNPSILKDSINKVADKRIKELNSRKRIQVGINMFPDSLDNYSLDDLRNITESRRLSYKYEVLKISSMQYKSRTGEYPKLIQINYGSTISFKLRADWVADFFKVAGIDVKQYDNITSIEEAVACVGKEQFVVLCANDESYGDFADTLAYELKNKEANSFIMLAGTKENTVSSPYIDAYINIKTNNYEFLHSLLDKMGVLNEKA